MEHEMRQTERGLPDRIQRYNRGMASALGNNVMQRLLITDIPVSGTSDVANKYIKIAGITDLGILWLMASEYNSHAGAKKTWECIMSLPEFLASPQAVPFGEKIVIGTHGDSGEAFLSGNSYNGDELLHIRETTSAASAAPVAPVASAAPVIPMFCTMLHHNNPEIRKQYAQTECANKWDEAVSLSPESGILVMDRQDYAELLPDIPDPETVPDNPNWKEIIDPGTGAWLDTDGLTGDEKAKWDVFVAKTKEKPLDPSACEEKLSEALTALYSFIKDRYNNFTSALKTGRKDYLELESPWKK